MTESFTKEQEERYQSYLRIYLKNEVRSLPAKDQINRLRKKNKKQWWMLAFNIIAIAFFSYSFYAGITQLSDTLLYVLLAVFVFNMGLIFYQKKRIGEVISYLKWKQRSS